MPCRRNPAKKIHPMDINNIFPGHTFTPAPPKEKTEAETLYDSLIFDPQQKQTLEAMTLEQLRQLAGVCAVSKGLNKNELITRLQRKMHESRLLRSGF